MQPDLLTRHDKQGLATLTLNRPDKLNSFTRVMHLALREALAQLRFAAPVIAYAGQRALLRRNCLGFVFQGFNLLPRMSLQDNVALPLVYAGVDKETRRAKARELLDKVGLGKYAESLPNRISGGQQQRVAIARALVNSPRLILADEPTGNLDSHTSEEIMRLFGELNDEGITIVLVTHEPDVAAHAKRQVKFLDGEIVSDQLTQQVTA